MWREYIHSLGVVVEFADPASDGGIAQVADEIGVIPADLEVLLRETNGVNGEYGLGVARGPRDDVFVWDHENDSRTWFASSLHQYLEWFMTGERAL